MGVLCSLISSRRVLIDPDVRDKADLIRKLVEALALERQVTDADQLYRDVMDREELSSTALGLGCAIPHAHSSGIGTTLLAAAKLARPVEFDAAESKPVSLVFLMAGPQRSSRLHLTILSKLARFLHDPQLREQLLAAADAEAFCRLLCEKEG